MSHVNKKKILKTCWLRLCTTIKLSITEIAMGPPEAAARSMVRTMSMASTVSWYRRRDFGALYMQNKAVYLKKVSEFSCARGSVTFCSCTGLRGLRQCRIQEVKCRIWAIVKACFLM